MREYWAQHGAVGPEIRTRHEGVRTIKGRVGMRGETCGGTHWVVLHTFALCVCGGGGGIPY